MGKQNERYHLNGLGVNWRIILKRIFQEGADWLQNNCVASWVAEEY